MKPNIPTEAVYNFCVSLGLHPNWRNMKMSWHLLLLAKMPLSDLAAAIDNLNN